MRTAKDAKLEISRHIIGSAMRVHTALGPGLLESAYQACLAHTLRRQNLNVEVQRPCPIVFDGCTLDIGYRIDVLVEGSVIVELKSVEKIAPIHVAQILSYLKLANLQLGLLINFNVVHLKQGIRRVVNGLEE